MSRSVDGAIRVTGEVIDYVQQFIEPGEDVYEEGATYFNFDKFFAVPEELLDDGNDVVYTAIIHGVAALNPESSFEWGPDFPKFESVELFNKWFDSMFHSSYRKSKKELEERSSFVDPNLLTQHDWMIKPGVLISHDRNGEVNEEELKTIFKKRPYLRKKYGCVLRSHFNPWAWTDKLECGFRVEKGIGFLSFDLFNSFPVEIAIKLSRDCPDQEIGVSYSVEDWGGYLYVFKNGECVFEDSYYEDDYDSEEESEEKVIKENPSSISYSNFYPREERRELTPEEKEERRLYWEKEHKLLEEEHWFNERKDTLPKNEDGTCIISDDMPEGARQEAIECNKIIIAKLNEPTYEEVVAELGRSYITTEETIKAITWLSHHEHLTEGWSDVIVTRDMPILVKAHVLFRRKQERENDEAWETMVKEMSDEDFD